MKKVFEGLIIPVPHKNFFSYIYFKTQNPGPRVRATTNNMPTRVTYHSFLCTRSVSKVLVIWLRTHVNNTFFCNSKADLHKIRSSAGKHIFWNAESDVFTPKTPINADTSHCQKNHVWHFNRHSVLSFLIPSLNVAKIKRNFKNLKKRIQLLTK
jgi:hypothetical protein